MIYLDASALVTFVLERPNFVQLHNFLSAHRHLRAVTSTVGLIETVRNCERVGSFPNLLANLLREYGELVITAEIRNRAVALPGSLKTLDAIHVVTAESLEDHLTALLTYDRQLAAVARDRGLPVASPGANL